MRIKKHGSEYKPQKDLPKYEKFKCEECGCEFSCEDNEYYVDLGGADNHISSLSVTYTISNIVKDFLVCSCPECHKIVKKIRERKSEPVISTWPTWTTTTSPLSKEIDISKAPGDVFEKQTRITCDNHLSNDDLTNCLNRAVYDNL